MREYNYLDIIKFDEIGILFVDNFFVEFEKCKAEWARINNVPIESTACVATRYLENDNRYFIFYLPGEELKLNFIFSGILRKKKSKNKFYEVQVLLNRYGYASYDMT